MKSNRILNLTMIFLLVTILMSCSQKEDKSKKTQEIKTENIFPVKTSSLEMKILDRTLEYTANLNAYKEVHYAPATPVRIDKIFVEVGDKVTKGQKIGITDRTQYKQALLQLESAETNFKRIDTLFKLGSMSLSQYDQSKTQYDIAKNNVEFLQENTTLKAPISGVITGKYFENGEFYSGAPNTQAGKAAVVSIMQTNKLKVLVNISQSHLNFVKKGMDASVSIDNFPEKVFTGKVTKVNPFVNPLTRTVQIEILIPNSNNKLKPGMFASIEIYVKESEAMMVPALSVLKQSGTNTRYVFIEEKGVAKKVEVKIGNRLNDKIEIISDKIKLGMNIITEGQSKLINGSNIKVLDTK